MRTVSILLLLILAAGCHTTKTNVTKAVIYYVPFQFEANESVTPENIKEKANSVEITDKTTIVNLDKLLAKSHEASDFDNKRVRLLIVMAPGGRSVWVDAEGGLLEADQKRRLDRKDFDQLESLVSLAVATGGEMR